MSNEKHEVIIVGGGMGMETPGNVGAALVDVEAEGVEGLYLVGERTSAAKVMGVYGSAQTALRACDLILEKYPVAS